MSEHFEIKPEFKQKAIRSYVIRGGRMTEGQKKAFETYWPQFGLSLYEGRIDPQKVFGRNAPLVVETGFGMGDSLLKMAQQEPDKNFIGIEVHPPGVGRLINLAGKAEVKNLRVYMADASDVLADCIDNDSIDRFQLYFPDPWHKKKHHKRRIVQKELIDGLRCKLAIGGVFHMATDWENYAEHAMEILSSAEGFVNLTGPGQFTPRPEFRPLTKFEQRGERLGHGVWDLLFRRSS